MPKNLNDILKGVKKSTTEKLTTGSDPGVDYADKMKDTRDFVAQHSIEKHADRVGNENPAAPIKKAYMKRHGHEPTPKDVKVYNKAQQNEETDFFNSGVESPVKGSINEVSQKAATSAYADANDPGSYHPKADNILNHIKRKFGSKAASGAEDHAYATHFGRGNPDTGDSLKGGLRKYLSKDTTKAGKIKHSTIQGMKANAKSTKVGGPKGQLPEEAINEKSLDEHKSMDGDNLKAGDHFGFKDGHEQYGKIHSISSSGHAKLKVWNSDTGEHDEVQKHVSRLWKEEVEQIDELQGYQGKKGQKALYKIHTRAFKRMNTALDKKDPKSTGKNFRTMDNAYKRMKDVDEEVEQINELGDRTIKGLSIKGMHAGNRADAVVDDAEGGRLTPDAAAEYDKHDAIRKRAYGLAQKIRAKQQKIKEAKACESCGKASCGCDTDDQPQYGKKDKPGKRKLLTDKSIQEKLNKDMSAGDVIKDFQASDDPRFKGDSKEKRKKRALAAYYGMQKESLSDQRSSRKTASEEARKEIHKALVRKKEREDKMKEEAAATETPISAPPRSTYPVDNSREGFRI